MYNLTDISLFFSAYRPRALLFGAVGQPEGGSPFANPIYSQAGFPWEGSEVIGSPWTTALAPGGSEVIGSPWASAMALVGSEVIGSPWTSAMSTGGSEVIGSPWSSAMAPGGSGVIASPWSSAMAAGGARAIGSPSLEVIDTLTGGLVVGGSL